jgi:hypothetical protein
MRIFNPYVFTDGEFNLKLVLEPEPGSFLPS